jgi:hypothetical protein
MKGGPNQPGFRSGSWEIFKNEPFTKLVFGEPVSKSGILKSLKF